MLAYHIDPMTSVSQETWMNMQRLPVSVMNVPHNTIIQVSLSYQCDEPCLPGDLDKQWMCRGFPSITDMKFCILGDLSMHAGLPYVSDKHHLQDHLLSKPILLTQWVLSPQRPEWWTCRCFPSVTNNGLFKTIFWVKLSPQRLCLQGNLNNEYE